MAASQDASLSRALTIRLNLQISLSAVPVVEEWMDLHLTRWLESIPLPPEMPTGHTVHFSVKLASDLSALSWRAYGNPAGFIPKMAQYFERSDMSQEDMALLDALGNGLEPALVGTWVTVDKGKVITGWQFCEEQRFADLVEQFSDHEAKAQLLAWVEDAGIEQFRRFSQSIGEGATSTIELPVPGVSIDDQLQTISQGFVALSGQPLPDPVFEAMATAVAPSFSLGVSIRRGQIVAIAAIAPGFGNDVVSQMCTACQLGFDDKHPHLQAGFGADGADRVEYREVIADNTRQRKVYLHVLPTESTSEGPTERN